MLAEAGAMGEGEPDGEAEGTADMPRKFLMRRGGVWWQPDPLDGERETMRPVHVCGPLRMVAATNDGAGNAWGALLEWEDGDARRHQWAMPRTMLAGDGTEVRARLLDGGLFLAPGRKARDRLAEYLVGREERDFSARRAALMADTVRVR